MTETLVFSKIYAQDIAFGTGTKDVELANGVTRTLNEVNITDLVDATTGNVIYSDPSGVSDDDFRYIIGEERLYVKKIAGGSGAADPLVIQGSSHATEGNVHINPDGGNVSIGDTGPNSRLHIKNAGPSFVTVENTSATPNDAGVLFNLAGSTKWHIGVDDSDGDKLKIGSGATVGIGVMAFSGSTVGVNINDPLGTLHVKTGSGATLTPSTDADDFIVESQASGGISILNGNANTGIIRYSTPGAVVDGWMAYDHNDTTWRLGVGGSEQIVVNNQGQMRWGGFDTTGFGPGIGIDQGGSSGFAIGAQADAIAHGVTSLINTTTFWSLGRQNNEDGGVNDISATEATLSRRMLSIYTTEDTTDTSSSAAPFQIEVLKASGTGTTTTGTTGNLFAIKNNTNTQFLVKGDGDIHTGSGAAPVALDDHDDIQLVETLRAIQIPQFKDKLGEFFEGNLEVLKDAGVVFANPNGSFMYSHKGMMGLAMDAIRQLAMRVSLLENSPSST